MPRVHEPTQRNDINPSRRKAWRKLNRSQPDVLACCIGLQVDWNDQFALDRCRTPFDPLLLTP
jgi:hypothetical protein